MEYESQSIADMSETPDFHEAVTAFQGKRKPHYSGAVKKSPVERERRSRHASPLPTIVCFQRRRGLACQARLAGIGSPTFFTAPRQALVSAYPTPPEPPPPNLAVVLPAHEPVAAANH